MLGSRFWREIAAVTLGSLYSDTNCIYGRQRGLQSTYVFIAYASDAVGVLDRISDSSR